MSAVKMDTHKPCFWCGQPAAGEIVGQHKQRRSWRLILLPACGEHMESVKVEPRRNQDTKSSCSAVRETTE